MPTHQNSCVIRSARNDAWKHPSFFGTWRDSVPSQKKGNEVLTQRENIARCFAFHVSDYTVNCRPSDRKSFRCQVEVLPHQPEYLTDAKAQIARELCHQEKRIFEILTDDQHLLRCQYHFLNDPISAFHSDETHRISLSLQPVSLHCHLEQPIKHALDMPLGLWGIRQFLKPEFNSVRPNFGDGHRSPFGVNMSVHQ